VKGGHSVAPEEFLNRGGLRKRIDNVVISARPGREDDAQGSVLYTAHIRKRNNVRDPGWCHCA
jgi:hypothetical protein